MKKIGTSMLSFIVIISIVGAIVAGAYVYQLNLEGNVTIISDDTSNTNYSAEAYLDSACTNPVTNIDFGTLYAGQDTTKTIYLKNTGDGAIHSLELHTELDGVSDSGCSGSMTVDLQPGSSVRVNLLLAIPTDLSPGDYTVSATIDCIA